VRPSQRDRGLRRESLMIEISQFLCADYDEVMALWSGTEGLSLRLGPSSGRAVGGGTPSRGHCEVPFDGSRGECSSASLLGALGMAFANGRAAHVPCRSPRHERLTRACAVISGRNACCGPEVLDRQFGRTRAAADLRHYHRRGPLRATALLLRGLEASLPPAATLLDIGGVSACCITSCWTAE
jgi:hypothetical protein